MEIKETNSEEPNKLGSELRSYREKLGKRIESVANLYRTREEAAAACGKSTDQLANYTRGNSAIPMEALLGLARGVAIRIEWLATGEGPMRSAEHEAAAAAHDLRLARAGDQIAEERAQYRIHAVGQSVRESRLTLERVEAAIGFRPTEQWRELLKTLIFVHGLDESGVERIIDLLKNEHEQRGG